MSDATPWTRFKDMHSGGRTKIEDYETILIEAPENAARLVFRNHFGRNPANVTCACCGQDFSVMEYDSLDAATEYSRSKGRGDPTPVSEYVERDDVLVFRDENIGPDDREGDVPPSRGGVF